MGCTSAKSATVTSTTMAATRPRSTTEARGDLEHHPVSFKSMDGIAAAAPPPKVGNVTFSPYLAACTPSLAGRGWVCFKWS
eukprot:2230320-Amphidinium_carterae.2